MLQGLIDLLQNEGNIDFNQSFALAQECLNLLDSQETEVDGHILLIYIIENWDKIHTSCHEIMADLVEKAGFYPYLEKYKKQMPLKSTAQCIRKESFQSTDLSNIYYHEEQKKLYNRIINKENLIISAPTSFGKSLLIEAVVASGIYTNILIIQPTLALLNETRIKLSKYKEEYKLILKTTQNFNPTGKNLFLLTAERALEYPNLPKINFLILDEFYKLSSLRNDARCDTLNNAFYTLLQDKSMQFLLLGPNIDSISSGFAEKYNAKFYKTKYSLVVNEENTISATKKRTERQKKLFDLLYSLKNEQTIVYCSSPHQTRQLSLAYMKYLIDLGEVEEKILSILEWISINISSNWFIYKILQLGIGVHNRTMPKHIAASIIEYFNQSKINCLFCTSTIIEGVNTNSKNIIYFDAQKGKQPINYFDYCNIRGRAGRMMVHLVGKIYNFQDPPSNTQTMQVDIPFYDQKDISDEVLITIQPQDIIVRDEQVKFLDQIPSQEKNIIRQNNISVKGQLQALKMLRDSFDKELVTWSHIPSYKQLTYTLGIAWDCLNAGTSQHPFSIRRLIYLTNKYANGSSVLELILGEFDYQKTQDGNRNKHDDDILDISISNIFSFLRNWSEYRVPKWLRVMHSLQELVCYEKGITPGNYTFLAAQLESGLIQENLALLREFNIPRSVLVKLQNKIPAEISEDEILHYIKENRILEDESLLIYEKELIQKNIL